MRRSIRRWRIVDCGDADNVHGDPEQSFRNIEEISTQDRRKGRYARGDGRLIPSQYRLSRQYAWDRSAWFRSTPIWDRVRRAAGQRLGAGKSHAQAFRDEARKRHGSGGNPGLGSSMKSDFGGGPGVWKRDHFRQR